MPRPAPTPADAVGRSPVHRSAQVAALTTVGLALVLAAVALLSLSAAQPSPALPWLLAVGLACAGAAIGWTLWRQRALEAALREVQAAAANSAEPQAGNRAAALPDAQAQAAHDQRLLGTLLADLPLPVFALDATAAGGAGSVVLANAAAARLLDAAPQELAGLAWSELRTRLPAGVASRAAQLFGEPAPVTDPAPTAWDVQARRVEAEGASPPLWLLSLAPASVTQPASSDHESFSYTVSHDLRAPIRVVEGFTRILKEDYGHQLDRIGNDHLDRVLGAAARMNSMIDALLTLSQLSSRPLARQPVNLSQLAAYVADDLRRQSPERQVGVHIEEGLQTQGDPTLLRVVLENLLGNAWKYTAKKPDAQIWFERSVHGGQSAFCVRDNGAGFDMRFADRLFGVFQRLHSANDFQGTGVGLASVQRIVRRHGGEIWAESEVQRGSRFHFTLAPAHPAP